MRGFPIAWATEKASPVMGKGKGRSNSRSSLGKYFLGPAGAAQPTPTTAQARKPQKGEVRVGAGTGRP